MRQSNTYIIIFTAIMTLIIGGALSLANQVLKPAQTRSIELDTKTQILRAVIEVQKGDDILGIYSQSIESLVVDYQGNEITTDEKGNPLQTSWSDKFATSDNPTVKNVLVYRAGKSALVNSG